MLKAGQTKSLKVERKTDYGYFLTDGQSDILLHQNEMTRPIKVGDSVNVFLYMDHQNRLAATMERPRIEWGEYDWLYVIDVHPKLGVFLDLGIHKNVLLSKDDLPQDRKQWPRKGDQLFVSLKHDQKGRLLARLGTDVELSDKMVPGTLDDVNTDVVGTVYKVILSGAFLFTIGNQIGYLHRDEMKHPVRLGERIRVRIKSVREDGRINVTQYASKEVAYEEDAALILQVLEDRGGAMPFTDETDPITIRERFQISKSAFKRALGKLMKEQKVYQEDGWTLLSKKFQE